MNRRDFITTTVGASLSAGMSPGALGQTTPALPNYYPADYGRLIDAAKPETQVLVYSSVTPRHWPGVIAHFNKLYPWIKVNVLELGSAELTERYLTEKGSGARTADLLVAQSLEGWVSLIGRNELLDYTSPETPKLPAWSRAAKGVQTYSIDPNVFAWNKALLPKDLVPTSLADLVAKAQANPAVFKGKIATFNPAISAAGYSSHYAFIERHGEAGWKTLAGFGPFVRVESNQGPMLEKLTAGEYVFGFFQSASLTMEAVKDPARAKILDFSFGSVDEGVPFVIRSMAVPVSSANPNAAKLLFDAILSHAGQLEFAKFNRTSVREDVTSEQTGGRLTYSELVQKIGVKNMLMVPLTPDVVKNRSAFLARIASVYKQG